MTKRLDIQGTKFIDSLGREVRLRGVNLGGSSKVPYPHGGTHLPSDFSDHREVSFIGRPFPLDEADEHFSRLHQWGFNFIRLLTPWEAIEHAGPGKYDYAYLDYITKLVEQAGEYGFYVVLDPHQDVWSRMTGGDGAPGWTLELIGMDWKAFKATGAALVMQFFENPADYPEMGWPANYFRYATATLFTLFFAGNEFAPQLELNGEPVQEFFQSHFIAALAQLAGRLKDQEHVLGFEVLNEPHQGYIGYPHLDHYPELLIPGLVFTPFQSMKTANGIPTEIAEFALTWRGIRPVGKTLVNPNGIRIWKEEYEDVWELHGVWKRISSSSGKPGAILLKPEYFHKTSKGTPVKFHSQFFTPFLLRYTEEIRKHFPEAMIFYPGDLRSKLQWDADYPARVAYAPHWYDGLTLFTKKFHKHFSIDERTRRPVFFFSRVKKMMKSQLARLKSNAQRIKNGVPLYIGEFGLPFDLNSKKAYRTGDYSTHEFALSLYYDLMDELQLNCSIWNYTPDNSNQWGDQWNKEDLSIFSKDQQTNPTDLNSGARALHGFLRPYPRYIPGEILKTKYDRKKPRFCLLLKLDPAPSPVTLEIFVPRLLFPLPLVHFSSPTSQLQITHELDELTPLLHVSNESNKHKQRSKEGTLRSSLSLRWTYKDQILKVKASSSHEAVLQVVITPNQEMNESYRV